MNETILKKITTSRINTSLVFMVLTVCFLTGQTDSFAETVALTWNANTESTRAGYKVYYADSPTLPFNGTGAVEGASPINVQKLTTASLSGLDPNRTHYLAITAYDTAGVESSYSSIVTIHEAIPPMTAVTAPANNVTVSGTVSVTATASDNVGVAKIEFYVNGVLQATDTATPYVYSWNTSALASGSYALMTKAYDAAGNVGQSSTVAVNVVNDTTVPVVSLTAPANSSTVSGTVAITASASDNVGVSKVEHYINGVLSFSGNIAPYTYNWNTTSVANGSYTLTVKAYDNAGNVGQSGNTTVTVNNTVLDTTVPTVTAFVLPSTSTSQTVAISSFTASDNVGVTGYLITSSSTKPLSSTTGWTATAPISVTFPAAGSKTAYAWAKDAAGNVSLSRSAVTTIALPDTTAPVVSAFTMPASSTSLTVAVSSLTATDAVGVTGYLITSSSTKPLSSATGWTASAPASVTYTTAGSKTAYAWAKDAAGNVSLSRSAVVTIALPDTTAPTVSIQGQKNISGVKGVLTITALATDNVAVSKVEFYVNGALASTATIAPYVYTWNTNALPNGTYIVMAKAYDAAGNVAQSASIKVSLPNVKFL